MTGHIQTTGTRAQVWHGTAKHTSGGLIKSNLMQNKAGRIVSRAKHNTAKREMRLVKFGYGTKKGKFGFVKLGSHKKRGSKRHGSRRMRGGATAPPPAATAPAATTTAPASTSSGLMGSLKTMSDSAASALKMKGGAGMGSLTPANLNSDYMIKDVVPQHFGPFERALLGGRGRGRSQSRGRGRSQRRGRGRSQRRGRQQRGGYFGNAFSPADAMGQGIDGQGLGPVAPATAPSNMAGGRRRRRHRQRGMRGGVGNRGYAPADLGSVDIQMAAGRGN